MRIWSIHPRYLDRQGLLAVWRETLLAQKVLEGETRGYTHHPQLTRFRASSDSLGAIGSYLSEIVREATQRGYRFDVFKVHRTGNVSIPVTRWQVEYEWKHLRTKLRIRDPERYDRDADIDFPEIHPIFRLVDGEVEEWERV